MSRPVVFVCLLLALAQAALAAVPMTCAEPQVEQGCHTAVLEQQADIGCELRCAQAGPAMAPSLPSAEHGTVYQRTYVFVPVLYNPPHTLEIFHPPINP